MKTRISDVRIPHLLSAGPCFFWTRHVLRRSSRQRPLTRTWWATPSFTVTFSFFGWRNLCFWLWNIVFKPSLTHSPLSLSRLKFIYLQTQIVFEGLFKQHTVKGPMDMMRWRRYQTGSRTGQLKNQTQRMIAKLVLVHVHKRGLGTYYRLSKTFRNNVAFSVWSPH